MTLLAYDALQMHDLPAGYTARPVTLDDAQAVVAMLNLGARAVTGADRYRVPDRLAYWQLPGFDLAARTRLVLASDGAVAGYAELEDEAPHVQFEHSGQVHPAHLGRGIGSYLVGWVEGQARALLDQAPAGVRVTVLGEVNDHDASARRLLQDFGYAHVRTAWGMVMDLDPDTPPAAPQWPDGISVRSLVPGPQERVLLKTMRTAFRDHWGYVEEPFEEDFQGWAAYWHASPAFDPSLWFMAVASDGAGGDEVIGTALCRQGTPAEPEIGWIFGLGVLRPWRRRGVAGALLQHCFAELWQRGRRKVGLGVDADSLSNAVHLYESVGMRPDPNYTYLVWEKELRPGVELSTRG